ncbi:MAG: hypothetical protein ABI580_09300 [Burkholderiaceae bacterium]
MNPALLPLSPVPDTGSSTDLVGGPLEWFSGVPRTFFSFKFFAATPQVFGPSEDARAQIDFVLRKWSPAGLLGADKFTFPART